MGSQKRPPKIFLPSSKLQLFEIKEILFFKKIEESWHPICLLNYTYSPLRERGK
jgi:hypothetical protein